MPNTPNGPRNRISTLPDAPISLRTGLQQPTEEESKVHTEIHKKIRGLNEKYPLISQKLGMVVGEILGRQFMKADDVNWQLEGFIHKPQTALDFFERKLEAGRKQAIEKRAKEISVNMPVPHAPEKLKTPSGTFQAVRPNPAEGLQKRVRTLLGGTIADPELMRNSEAEKPKK